MLSVTLRLLSVARVINKSVSVYDFFTLVETQRKSILLLRLIHPWQSQWFLTQAGTES